MNIGFVIGRIGGIDGVALESEKWIKILQKQGHSVHIIAGHIEAEFPRITELPELDFHHPETVKEQDQAFFTQNVEEAELLAGLQQQATYIENKLLEWIAECELDSLVIQNAIALPCHLRMGMALANVLKKTNLHTIAHNHDFFWERSSRYESKFAGIRSIIAETFPVRARNIKHVVINEEAQKELQRRFDISSTIVPNVMDFSKKFVSSPEVQTKLRAALKLKDDDIALFQITRIVKRKGIEAAIQLVKELADPKIKLIITGDAADDENLEYYHTLTALVEEYGLEEQVTFAGDLFTAHNQRDCFSLEDAYCCAVACTYFSTYEGFGNAFVEAVLAKKPIFVNNYKPVYWPDIGSKGFETVMLEDNYLGQPELTQIRSILKNPKKQKDIAEHNFSLGEKHFSFAVLDQKLSFLCRGFDASK